LRKIDKNALLKDLNKAEHGQLKEIIYISTKDEYKDLLGAVVILVPSRNHKKLIKNRKNRLCVTFEELLKVREILNSDNPKLSLAILRAFNGSIIE
jgi:hypothetical protein